MPTLFSPETPADLWIALGSEAALSALSPLCDAHRRGGEAKLILGGAADIPAVLRQVGNRQVTVLVAEDPSEPSQRAQVEGPFLLRSDGPDALLGWVRLPIFDLRAYARRAAQVLQRPVSSIRPVIFLGPRERRYLELIDDLEARCLGRSHLTALRWTADRIRRGPMLAGLRLGAAAGVYVGHGGSGGWHAYGGLSAQALVGDQTWSQNQTCALLFSLSCGTGAASAVDAAPGLSDLSLAGGVAGAIFAPVANSWHDNTRRLAKGLVNALADGAQTLRESLSTARYSGASLAGYAIIGDPALRASSAPGAHCRSRSVFAPAPDCDLTGAARL